MLRTGIYSINQLNHNSLNDIFGKERNISINLYEEIEKIVDQGRRVLYSEMILNRFNSDRNVIKRTYSNRFNNFDDSSIEQISTQKYNSISILDIGISDGRASIYFLRQSIDHLKEFSYTGSDIQIRYYMYRRDSKSKSYLIVDADSKIIELVCPPFVWNTSRVESSFYFINNCIKGLYLKMAKVRFRNGEYNLQKEIEIVHPDFKALLKMKDTFSIRNYNVFNRISEEYTIIRAMNLLHGGYFSDYQLSQILENIYNGLTENGIFIEGSNENSGSKVQGAIYKKVQGRFIKLCEPEKPSRISDLVLSFRPLH
jgi:hypothetical protein